MLVKSSNIAAPTSTLPARNFASNFTLWSAAFNLTDNAAFFLDRECLELPRFFVTPDAPDGAVPRAQVAVVARVVSEPSQKTTLSTPSNGQNGTQSRENG